jgi:prevent-host-death family protein
MNKARTIKLSEARSTFSSLINDVFRTRGRVLIEKSGIPVAAVVSLDDLEHLERLDAERAERFKVVDEFRAAFADVSPEEIEREAAKAVAEARKKLRAERVARQSA